LGSSQVKAGLMANDVETRGPGTEAVQMERSRPIERTGKKKAQEKGALVKKHSFSLTSKMRNV